MKILKVIFTIWLIGALISYFSTLAVGLKACVKQDGLVKGVFMCDKDPRPNNAIDEVNILIKSATWPFRLFSTKSVNLETPLSSQDIERLIKRLGVDNVASDMARQINSMLPQKKGLITTHIKSFYEVENRFFYFVYKVADDGFDTAIELGFNKDGTSKEEINAIKAYSQMIEEPLFETTTQNERLSHTTYFCTHSYYRPIMRSGVVIKFIYTYKNYENYYDIRVSDC